MRFRGWSWRVSKKKEVSGWGYPIKGVSVSRQGRGLVNDDGTGKLGLGVLMGCTAMQVVRGCATMAGD